MFFDIAAFLGAFRKRSSPFKPLHILEDEYLIGIRMIEDYSDDELLRMRRASNSKDIFEAVCKEIERRRIKRSQTEFQKNYGKYYR